MMNNKTPFNKILHPVYESMQLKLYKIIKTVYRMLSIVYKKSVHQVRIFSINAVEISLSSFKHKELVKYIFHRNYTI